MTEDKQQGMPCGGSSIQTIRGVIRADGEPLLMLAHSLFGRFLCLTGSNRSTEDVDTYASESILGGVAVLILEHFRHRLERSQDRPVGTIGAGCRRGWRNTRLSSRTGANGWR